MLVLGGGDSAMDCARSAIRLGAKVSIAYRGPEERLRASPLETGLARRRELNSILTTHRSNARAVVWSSGVRFKTPLGNQHINADSIVPRHGAAGCAAGLAERVRDSH